MVKIPEVLIEQIPTWNFETVYEHFDLLEPNERLRKSVEEGINMKFPIEIFIDGNYEEFPKTRKVRIHGYGEGDLITFKREIKKRKKEMLRFIYENWDSDVTEGRVKEE